MWCLGWNFVLTRICFQRRCQHRLLKVLLYLWVFNSGCEALVPRDRGFEFSIMLEMYYGSGTGGHCCICTRRRCCVYTHQLAALFAWNNVMLKVLHHTDAWRIVFPNFIPIPIGLFWRGSPTRKKKKNMLSRDIGSIPDPNVWQYKHL